eukprot:COSAG01_NODE_3115_length_6565_cov_23.371172_1_plen_142_part_00
MHQRWRQAFRVFDAEQQGWVDAEKLRRVFASFGDYELSDEQLETMLPPPPAGCPPSNGTGRVAIRLPQFAALMESDFKHELWCVRCPPAAAGVGGDDGVAKVQRNAGKSQRVLVMIDPMISPRPRWLGTHRGGRAHKIDYP